MKKKTVIILLILIVAFGAGLRVFRIGKESFWHDEMTSVVPITAKNISDIPQAILQVDPWQPPLHFILVRLWITIFGRSEAAFRFFSALCGVIAIPVVYKLASEMYEEKTGLYASLIFAASFQNVLLSQETRNYTMLALLALVSFLYLFRMTQRKKVSDIIFYALSIIAALYTHYLIGFILIVQNILFFVFHKKFKIRIRPWLAVQAICAFSFLPMIKTFIWQFDRFLKPQHFAWIKPPTIKTMAGTVIAFIGGNSITTLFFLAICVIAIIKLKEARQGKGEAKGLFALAKRTAFDRFFEGAFLGLWIVVPIVAMFAVSKVKTTLLGPGRYTLYLAPAYYILIGRGSVKLKKPGIAVIIFALALTLYPVTKIYTTYSKPRWKEAEKILRASGYETRIILYPKKHKWEVAHYFPESRYESVPYGADDRKEKLEAQVKKKAPFAIIIKYDRDDPLSNQALSTLEKDARFKNLTPSFAELKLFVLKKH